LKVILKESIKNLGEKDDLVEVKDGYARNYLIPRGLAEEASEGNISRAKARRDAEEQRQEREKEEARKLSEKLNGKVLEIKAKTGSKGKLFGSITSMDIVEALKREYGTVFDRKKIVLEEPIKSVGETTVEIKLYPGVSTQIKVKVIAE
jgi:large subunit ribosomal protein L9